MLCIEEELRHHSENSAAFRTSAGGVGWQQYLSLIIFEFDDILSHSFPLGIEGKL